MDLLAKEVCDLCTRTSRLRTDRIALISGSKSDNVPELCVGGGFRSADYVHVCVLALEYWGVFCSLLRNEILPTFFKKNVYAFLIQVLLVFTKEDNQCNGFCRACEKAGFKCTVTKEAQAVLACFLAKHHDIIIIDHRNPRQLDAEALCR